ncbi:hypothetical protein ATL40_2783 [Serinibacter salmoneus]|uniref:Uncharacterized protein n=1 Tax=Serinibacter salmoneus TaxID=556530 RepID=A0A2A9D5M9_9MICO|nr:hypothetical protein ATL40_2783 [Serinibacter salmoneus]
MWCLVDRGREDTGSSEGLTAAASGDGLTAVFHVERCPCCVSRGTVPVLCFTWNGARAVFHVERCPCCVSRGTVPVLCFTWNGARAGLVLALYAFVARPASRRIAAVEGVGSTVRTRDVLLSCGASGGLSVLRGVLCASGAQPTEARRTVSRGTTHGLNLLCTSTCCARGQARAGGRVELPKFDVVYRAWTLRTEDGLAALPLRGFTWNITPGSGRSTLSGPTWARAGDCRDEAREQTRPLWCKGSCAPVRSLCAGDVVRCGV